MDPQTLVQVLGLALSSNEDRKIAEERLNQFQHVEGHCVKLLQVIVSNNLEISVRHFASIHFKNVIAKHWAPQNQGVPSLSEADRPIIRDHLVEAIIHVPLLIRVQLGECLKSIIQTDYPIQWPGLLAIIDVNLKSRDQQRISGALFVLRVLARKYEFKDQEERIPIYPVIETTLPVTLEIFKYLISIANPSIDIAHLMKLICKIFWSMTYLEIPKMMSDPAVFQAWMTCFHILIERPVPTEGQPEDYENRKSWGWWKVKKWALHIVNRLHHRFGDGSQEFAVMFQKEFATKFLESYLKLLGTLRHGGFLTDRVINLAIQYLILSIGKNYAYAVMKSQLDIVLFEIVFPLLCFDSFDERLWADDPHEYVRKGYDIIEEMYSPRTAAQNFILELFRKRWKENLSKFVVFIAEIFARYNAAPPNMKPYREKDGALLAVGSLSERLRSLEPYKEQLEILLVQHVYPEFSSPAGHLRAKAAWVAGQYAGIEFKDPMNFRVGFRSIVTALKDPELPVRVDSVIALKYFVEATQDLEEIRAILPALLDEFFKLMNEVENEDLVVTLEAIVDKFGEEMAPYAFGLCQNLANAFWKCLQSTETDEDEDDSGALAAVGCLRAIGTILESVSGLPDLFPQMEPILLPIMKKMLTTDGQDVFEEVLEIVSYMTYYSPSISAEMWTLWPLIVDALDDWAVDYYENILVPLDNYISRSTERFLQWRDPYYQQRLFDSLSAMLGDDKLEDPDVIAAPKLIESVLQNCKGRVDEWVEPYLRISIDRLRKAQRNGLKDLLMEVIANALYYNPLLTLNILQKLQMTGYVFQTWFQMLYATKKNGVTAAHFKREHDKKVCILGLSSILALPVEAMPVDVQTGIGQIFKAVLKLLIAYKTQVEEAKKEMEEQRDYRMDDEGEDDLEQNGDDEDDDEVSNSNFRHLVRSFRREDSDDDDSDDEFIEDEEFQAAIDPVDPFVFFADIVKGMSEADPLKFQTLTRSLDFSHQAMAHAVEQHAAVRRVEIAAAAAAAGA